MRTNVVLNDELVAKAFQLTEARTKRELLHIALTELVRIRSKDNLADLAGRVLLRHDFDHKEARSVRPYDR